MSYSFIGGGYSNTIEQHLDLPVVGYSSIVGGKSNSIHRSAYSSRTPSFSFLGGGEANTIGGHKSDDESNYVTLVGGSGNTARGIGTFIGGGTYNEASQKRSFIGGGDSNVASSSYSVIVGGDNNISSGTASFVGSGRLNTASGAGSVVTGGEFNRATGQLSFVGAGGGYTEVFDGVSYNIKSGNWARGGGSAIPAGTGLEAFGSCQTVIGHFNKQLGNPLIPFTAFLGNERLFVIGNGRFPSTPDVDTVPVRSNAYEVTEKGAAIVFDNLGTDWTATPPTTAAVSTRPAIEGARYKDNTAIASGDVDGTTPIPTLNYGFGVATAPPPVVVQRLGVGAYRIFLNYVDPYLGQQVTIANGSSVVATIKDNSCMFISTTPVQWDAINGFNFFDVLVTRHVLQPIVGGGFELVCNSIDAAFMFVVHGRP